MPYGTKKVASALTKGPKKNPSRIAEAGALGVQVMDRMPYPPKHGASTKKKFRPMVSKKTGASMRTGRRHGHAVRAFGGGGGY